MLDLVLGFHLLSAHSPQMFQENFNPGIYVRAPSGLSLGLYRNSWHRASAYAGWTWLWEPHAHFDLGFSAGLITGYQRRDVPIPCAQVPLRFLKHAAPTDCWVEQGYSRGAVTVLAAPSVRFGPFRLSYIPRIGEHSSVAHLSVEGKWH